MQASGVFMMNLLSANCTCSRPCPSTLPTIPAFILASHSLAFDPLTPSPSVFTPPLPPGKLPFSTAPPDDRNLNDMHLALYNDVIVFDQATKIIYAISWVHIGEEVGWRLWIS